MTKRKSFHENSIKALLYSVNEYKAICNSCLIIYFNIHNTKINILIYVETAGM